MSTDPLVRRKELGMYLEISSQRMALSKTSSHRFSDIVSKPRIESRLAPENLTCFLQPVATFRHDQMMIVRAIRDSQGYGHPKIRVCETWCGVGLEPEDSIVLHFMNMAVLSRSKGLSNPANTMHNTHGTRRAQTLV